jgi:hypothetical protein
MRPRHAPKRAERAQRARREAWSDPAGFQSNRGGKPDRSKLISNLLRARRKE